jgi:hypothetical protein
VHELSYAQRAPDRLSRAAPACVLKCLPQDGCGTILMYGFGSFQLPKISLACSLLTEPAMMTSSPCFQFTGVATSVMSLYIERR